MKRLIISMLICLIGLPSMAQVAKKLEVKHHNFDNDGVNVHFVEMGKGPLIVMLHGFPDFWYGWYPIMEVLSENYKVVAMDLRGYNKAGTPESVALYEYDYLMADVIKVIDYFGEDSSIIIGHDWGAAIGWRLTMHHPNKVSKFISLSIPHLKGTALALSRSTRETGSNYAARFFQEGFEKNISLGWFTSRGIDDSLKPHYQSAFERSDPRHMLKYYPANFGTPEELIHTDPSTINYPDIDLPVLIIQGLQDPFITAEGLNRNWEFNKGSTSIHVIPEAGHFPHHEDPSLITRLIVQWLGLFDR